MSIVRLILAFLLFCYNVESQRDEISKADKEVFDAARKKLIKEFK